ncbi:MAG: hypothetical protein FWC09_09575 [Lachnospiraceae bacterium]|nr:hypothetical protein [Lachnospiraceae bacterium]
MKKIKKSLEVLNTQFNLVALLGVVFTGFNTFSQKFGLLEKVDKSVSGILFGLLVVLALIYIFKYIKKPVINIPINDRELFDKLKQKGIDGIQDEAIGDFRMTHKMVSNANSTIEIIAYYADILLGSMSPHLLDSINKNAIDVRILVAKKEKSEFLDDVSALEGGPIPTTDTLGIINSIKENIRPTKDGKKGSIEYHEYNTEARYALILVDRKWAWWTPYHTGLKTEKITSFELIKTNDNAFINLCIEHFNKLWTKYA